MGDVTSREIEAPVHWDVQACFDVLRQQLCQHDLFGEVLRSDDDAIGMRGTASGERKGDQQQSYNSSESRPSQGH